MDIIGMKHSRNKFSVILSSVVIKYAQLMRYSTASHYGQIKEKEKDFISTLKKNMRCNVSCSCFLIFL